ncbi:MAG: glycosyltransferase family 39 protein [Lamprobacter sp.]|uniref:glycosyltransferase family 39 protein n=1 Tax=Lamprobacter sp. TaxID=3100796 RepID=UPI002B2579B0|nr:glycosyltransferase family 39 protein [Lamprobacter sp.]MEA3643779.1 glycosyltransferase family 39 protein [Lamprobacter sp.]
MLLLILGVTAWRLLVADALPVTRDEAYYFNWARQLAWGYFDHPPGVALIGVGTWLDPGSTLAARLGAVALGGLSLLVLWRLYHASGLSSGNGLLLALILSIASIPGLIAGVITTPDTVLMLCWPLALHEALRALQGQRKRWLTAGLATGLGLLGKYSMVMIGPVFLWALLRADPRALRTPWPYLGGLIALLVFSPNLVWNAQNDWLTLRFQFGHGFSTDSGPIRLAADALPAVTGTHAYAPESPAPMDLGERLSSLGGYLGEQLLFWGLLLVPIGIALWRLGRRSRLLAGQHSDESPSQRPNQHSDKYSGWHPLWRFARNLGRRFAGIRPEHNQATSVRATTMLDPVAISLLGAAALMPLSLFALIALGSEVEANWAAPYLVGAAPFIALLLQRSAGHGIGSDGWALIAAAGNLVLISIYVLYAVTAFPPLPDAVGRALRETQGFETLADYSARLPEPVVADRYQFAAMLNFYQPQLAVSQWPGITRPSEYGRGKIAPLPDPQALRQSGFWLLARKFSAPEITGFEALEIHSLYSCPDGRFSAIDGAAAWEAGGCDDPANVWRLYRYRSEAAPGVEAP